MTGGEVFAKRVMLNERDSTGGFGKLTVSGGVLNVGSLTGSTLAISNAICADAYAPYLIELGGAGGTIRAVTNLWIPAGATLYGTNANAITIDSQQWTVSMTNRLTGAGGLNKAGSGTLILSGNNSYAGATRVLAGALVRGSAGALPAGGLVLFGVSADGSSGRLHSDSDLSLAGIVIGVANPELLDKSKAYTIASYGGSLTSQATGKALPGPWYLHYDWPNKRVQLRAAVGTLIRVN
jgi:autotransporter-associated beta strand protein